VVVVLDRVLVELV